MSAAVNNTVPDSKREAMLKADPAEIAATLGVFVQPGGIGEIRIIPTGNGKPYGFYFSHDEIPEAARIAARESETAKGVYVVINEISLELSDRPRLTKASTLTKDADITRRKKFYIDFDPSSPERGANDSATDAEKANARELRNVVYEFLREAYFPDPMFADSGNGYHLVYAIDEPNDDATKELLKAFLNVLARKFSTPEVGVDISVFNAARITKLYPTIARKGEHRPDRPHRKSGIEDIPEGGVCAVSRKQIESIVADRTLFDTNVEPSEKYVSTTPINGTSKYTMPTVFPVGGRHANLLSVAGGLRAMGFQETEIYSGLQIVKALERIAELIQTEAFREARNGFVISQAMLSVCGRDFETYKRNKAALLAEAKE